ncbi:MAG TPA: nucleoside-diphosphate kinase [Candidatus Paceibacterota bacterium]
MQTPHYKHERTMVIIKPDGIQRSLMGEIIKRYEQVGLKLVGVKMMIPTAEQIEKHYTLDPEWRVVTGLKTIKSYTDKGLTPPFSDPMDVTAEILRKVKLYMTSGPVVVMVWQGAHAVEVVRKLTGSTEPLSSVPGTIRGDYVLDSYRMSDSDKRSVRNLVHASGSVKEAQDEINHWFKKEELFNYNIVQEAIMYDVNLDGIME